MLLMSLEPLVALRNWIFCVLCCCKGGGFQFILRELNFGTAVLRQLLLQHAHLMIVQDSPCVVDVARAPGCVEELDFLHAMLTLIAMLPIPHDSSFWALK